MVCSFGNGRMAVMARIIAAGSASSQNVAEIGLRQLAAKCMYRELHEADEPNLLDEEDMHVFGVEPMTDPLHLVCCNACKKPVKASQYAAHSELCRSLKYVGEITTRDGVGKGHRKAPKKERKKLLMAHSNPVTPVAEQDRSESVNVDNVTISETRLGRQPGMASSQYADPTGNSAFVDVSSVKDGRGVVHENIAYSQFVLPPPTKRSKLLSSQVPSIPDDPEKTSGLSKITSCRGKDYQPQSIAGAGTEILSNEHVLVSKCHGQNSDGCLWKNDIPAPLATKIYYSQRSNRLRSAVAYMYHVSSNQGVSSDMSPELSQKSMQVNTSSQTGEHADGITNKEGAQSAFTPDHMLGQISRGSLDKLEGCLQDTDLSSQFPISNLLGPPQMAPVGLLGSKYLSNPYSHGGNSGQPIGGTLQQQPNGSVHVL